VVRRSRPGSVASTQVWIPLKQLTITKLTKSTELDVDLLSEQELYDPNTIGSMLKHWLRELPEPMFPYKLQHALGAELQRDNPRFNVMGQSAPQKLRDALSELPPFNYYLLFAVTCHLSLLLSHQERNRMDLNNLSICIGPCLYLERWLFNYLVGDWRNCWQGCWTEKQQLDEEKRLEDPSYVPPPSSSDGAKVQPSSLSDIMNGLEIEERALSSGNESGSSGRNHSSHGDFSIHQRNDSRANHVQQPSRTRNTRPSTENMREMHERTGSGHRYRETTKPTTYIPAGLQHSQPQPPPQSYGGNGVVGALPTTGHRGAYLEMQQQQDQRRLEMQQQDERRPTTSDSRVSHAMSRDGSVPATPSTSRPHRVHHRSQSDLPLSPTQGNFPEHLR
jgi:hypothetical protein